MDESPLRRLAPEIRLIIYELVLVQDSRILLPMQWVDFDDYVEDLVAHMWDVVLPQRAPQMSLMSVCKEIRAESLPVFYGKNTFLSTTVNEDGWFLTDPTEHLHQLRNLRRWLNTIGSRNAALCKRIYMYAGSVNGHHAVDTGMDHWQNARILEKEMLANAGLNQNCLYDIFIVHFWEEGLHCLVSEDCHLDNWEMIVPVCHPGEILAKIDFEPFDSVPSLEILDHCDSHCVHRCEIVEKADTLLKKLVSSGSYMEAFLNDMTGDLEIFAFLSWSGCRVKAGGNTELKDGKALEEERVGGTS